MRGSEWKSAAVSGVFAFALSACGGGGGGNGNSSPPPPPPANRSPVFTSADNVSVTENTSGSVYTISVSDPEGGAVTLSVVPGQDEGFFNIDFASSSISFLQPPDFEIPLDTGNDNTYLVTLEARDPAGNAARLTITFTVTDLAETMALQRVGTGFSQPLFVTSLPGTNQLVVLEKSGRARLLDPATGVTDSVDFLNLTGIIGTSGEGGLLGIAFSPAFATDRTFYVNVTNLAGNTEIRRYETMTGAMDEADPLTEDRIMLLSQPFNNHNGGWLGFGPDGLLYIPTGDGGSGGDPGNRAQNPNDPLGKILRIDVSGDDFPADADRDYAIPANNAFPGGVGGLPEVYATGLRNPFRCSFDRVTGDLFLGDVGQAAIEEIDRIGTNEPGVNFGWNLQEGTQSYNGGADNASFRDPVAEYGHGSGPTQGNSVTGGYVHRGNIQPIKDTYVFGDFVSGNIWSVPVANLVNGSTVAASAFTRLNDDLVPDAGSVVNLSSFGEDEAGNLYLVSFGSGEIFKVVSVP